MRAWTSNRRVIALVGGTGSGKTWLAPLWVYKKLIDYPGSRCLCIGLGYDKHVHRVMIRQVKALLDSKKVKYTENKRTGSVLLPNGSEFLFGSAENPLSLEGAHLEFVWIDEAGMMPIEAWEVAQRRTGLAAGRGMGQILITTIPYFEGWLKKEVYDMAMKGDDTIEWIKCRSKDNPEYTSEELERMKRKNPIKYLVFYEGEWAKLHGLIFPDPDDSEVVVDPFPIPKSWPAFAGHDWGYNAPTTGVWGRLDPTSDILYIVAEYEVRERTIEDNLAEWYDMGLTYIDEAWGDPADPDILERAFDLGYPIHPGNNRVSFGLDCVADRLITGRLKVWRTCKKWRDHRSTYRWATAKDDDETLLDKPEKPQPAEHLMDATRYLCTGLVESGMSSAPDPIIQVKYRGVGR